MVIGAAEAGKTTFTASLANALHARGLRVAVVDADVGQSEIGPPGTVGLGEVAAPLERPGDARLVAFEFVGNTSPARQSTRVARATSTLVARAREAFDRVVVDTSGFVAGGFGAALKQRKIAGVMPDALVLVQRADECEHVVRGLAFGVTPRILRIEALTGARPRTAAARRRHREAALARHLQDARPVVLETTRVGVKSLAGAAVILDAIAPRTIVALHGATGDTLALGVVEAVDVVAHMMTVMTTASAREVVSVTVGEMTA